MNEPRPDLLITAFNTIGVCLTGFLRCVIGGTRRLNRLPPLAAFLVSCCISAYSAANRAEILSIKSLFGQPLPVPAVYILYWFLLALPLITLASVGKICNSK